MNNINALVSMQSALKCAGAVRTAQNELNTEASVYKPSFAYKGDREKAAALSSRANDLSGNIGEIVSKVQNKMQNTTDKADKNYKKDTLSQASGSPETDNSEENTSDTVQNAKQGEKNVSATASAAVHAHFNILI